MAAHVIAIATGKGGVGKTSITAALAGVFAHFGHSVALVELDAQGDLADDLGLRPGSAESVGHDGGASVLRALTGAGGLAQTGIAARPRLQYYPGGEALASYSLAQHLPPSWDGLDLGLRRSLDEIRNQFDVILLDTPPTQEPLQRAALVAADWLLIPTGADMSSIRALYTITSRLVEVEPLNPGLRLLGVVLWNVPTSATRIRAEVRDSLEAILATPDGSEVPLFQTTIRSAMATAWECRQRGMLPIEMGNASKDAEPFWKALAEGRTPERLPSSALALAGDYAHLANEILVRTQIEAKP